MDSRPDGFDGQGRFPNITKEGFFPEQCIIDSFEIEYLFPIPLLYLDRPADAYDDRSSVDFNARILIEKEEGKRPVIKWIDRRAFTDSGETTLTRTELKHFLPQFVVGYSSGENETLSLPFFKMSIINYDEYETALKDGNPYYSPEGRLIYLDKTHSQAIFLTNYLMQHPALLKPFQDTMGIKSIKKFRIIINKFVNRTAVKITEEDLPFDDYEVAVPRDDIELTKLLMQSDSSKTDFKPLDKLIRCATAKYVLPSNNTIYLDYFIDDDKIDGNGEVLMNDNGELIGLSEMKKAFRAHFDNDPLELFKAFQVLLTLNLYDVNKKVKDDLYRSGSLYVNETVPVLASDKRVFRFKDFDVKKEGVQEDILTKQLSDGEHQFLHSIGLCLLFKNTNSLFLLDEPETHLNPDWRAEFISTLRNCLKKSDKDPEILRDILITTHSPFLISDTPTSNVLKFTKAAHTGLVTCERPDFTTYGASINQITIEIFNKANTIGDLANETIAGFQNRFENGEDIDELIKEIDDKMGESVEKTILINRLLKNI